MHRSHSALAERKVPLRHLPAGTAGRPKVVRIVTRLNIGGPAIHTVLLTREMAARGFRPLLVAGACESGEGDMSYLVRTGDPVCRVPELSRSVRPWNDLVALWKIWRLLRRERPDIVHTHTAMAGCLGRLAAVLSRTPVVVHTFHGNSLSEYFSWFPAAVFRRVERLLARFTDALCVVAPQQAAELSGTFRIAPRKKFRVLPLGLELDDYFGLRPPAPAGPLTVGWFGRMVPVKNVPLLVRTIGQALGCGQDVRFLIAGDGPDSAAVAGAVDLYGGRVEWLGWQREILPVLARCDVVLQTSRNEGTPVALIQAMAAARPFVSTAVGGVVDMVSGEPQTFTEGARRYANGVLAEPGPEALAGVLAALARDRALITDMGLRGRDLAWRRYRKELLVENLDALYRELLQNKPNRLTKTL